MKLRTALGLITLLTAIFGSPPHAEAGLRFCNQGTFRLSVAVGFVDREKRWVARGWDSLEPGECKDGLGYALDNRFYYFHARGHDENAKVKYVGETPFCIESRKFRIYQAAYGKSSADECAKDGLRSEKFVKVDVKGKPEYIVNLGTPEFMPSTGANPSAPGVESPATPQKPVTITEPPPAPAQKSPPAAEPPTAPAEQPAPARRPRATQQAPSNLPSESSAAPGDGGSNGKACQRYPNLC